jgi:hypothetical protein
MKMRSEDIRRKGQDVVEKNWAAIEEGAKQVREIKVPEEWKNAVDEGLNSRIMKVIPSRSDL